MTTWKIMAGRGSRYIDDFLEQSVIAVAIDPETDFTECLNKDAIAALNRRLRPDMTERQVSVAAGWQLRFLQELAVGDRVLVYEPQTRLYHVGSIDAEATFRPDIVPDHPVVRPVAWEGTIRRDDLSTATKNSLGAILTLFRVPSKAEQEIEQRLSGNPPKIGAPDADISLVEEDVENDPFADIAGQALERVKDVINALDWADMQEIVASLLRALGYRTSVSPGGPDRGKDIVASKNGFGFERPRIVEEVKHRQEAMGAQEIRSFLGCGTAMIVAFMSARGGLQRTRATKRNALPPSPI